MQCTPYREAVSARLDGEAPGLPPGELDAHLDACPGCAAWARQAELVTRRARLAAAPAVPDLTAAVLTALPRELPGTAAAARARLVTAALRLALLAVGVAQAAAAWPALVAGTGAMSAPVHMAHETGAWGLATAAALLAVAAAPRLATGALPFLGTLVATLAVLTVADLRAGHVDAGRAAAHLLLLAGAALVAALAWRGRRRRALPALGRERVPA
ncbi:Predicted anti-sigma-YlaC factor YlaD, contains Zn-finger domain [Geodermatophilus pulveris]|uniref:Predicted anti-sigma-YlaC factor YlaD, contains Zn-finger domain n=1 Tax=Geodermatophilus pulveris TaxID=1564159 RepID=A0A239DL66_9ACTN|nr:zf-HC2 domain-containing protein [Geodermatophilus pulveris]SNS32384.1 Predicted anti-sigma-YlaC factor YlaD, contains Zn-finger domain [Geodermatophilus pulveris]